MHQIRFRFGLRDPESEPDSAGEAYSASRPLFAGVKGFTSNGRRRQGSDGEGREREEREWMKGVLWCPENP